MRERAVGGRDGADSASSDSETEGKEETPNTGFNIPDKVHVLPPFAPERPTGIHFEGPVLRDSMTTEVDFFRLFITPQMVRAVVTHTNTYALI